MLLLLLLLVRLLLLPLQSTLEPTPAHPSRLLLLPLRCDSASMLEPTPAHPSRLLLLPLQWLASCFLPMILVVLVWLLRLLL